MEKNLLKYANCGSSSCTRCLGIICTYRCTNYWSIVRARVRAIWTTRKTKNNNSNKWTFDTYVSIHGNNLCIILLYIIGTTTRPLSCKGHRGRANRHHHLFYGRHVIVGHTIAGWEATGHDIISDWSADSRGRLRVDQMRFDTRNYYCYRPPRAATERGNDG